MAAQKGSALLIKIGDGATPTEVFTDLVGLRTKTMNLNSEMVDITNADNTDKWRELLAAAGIKSCSVSGSGVFKDGTPDATLRTDFAAQTLRNFQIVVPDFGTFEGAFQITQLNYAGEHNGEVTYEVALESSGEPAFTVA